MDNFFVLITLNLALSILIGFYGSSKSIGFLISFLVSLILTPVIGFFIVLFSGDNKKVRYKFEDVLEEAKRLEFRSDYAAALDKYKDVLFYLQNEFKNISPKYARSHNEAVAKVTKKIESLESQIPA